MSHWDDALSERDEFAVRRMQFTDLAAVEAVENRTYDQPWPIGLFSAEMANETAVCLVCQYAGQVVGYLVADMFIDVWHIMNVCVDGPYRRRRVASRLLGAYLAITESERHRGHTLEVRASNVGAQELYRGLGFVATGVRPGYYSNDGETAISMWRDWQGESA
jgi:ribosomal-protein-alanine N-acetyltransferase